jgi:hypothetical protein
MAGMALTLILGVSLLLGIVQISIFKSLPQPIKYYASYYTFFGVLMNFGLSSVVLLFTGVGAVAGISNLAGSVLVGLYLVSYKARHKLYVVRKKHFFGLFTLPHVVAGDMRESWLI